jgi:hypothetical protein
MSTNPLDRHGSLYGLAQAAADNDAVAEERGLEGALRDLGMSVEDVRYVAEQRALRAVLAFGGRANELGSPELKAVALTEEERKQMDVLTVSNMDAIALGVRYGRRRP